MNTENLNLVLKFRLAGNSQLHVKAAARIKIDGRGGLVFYDAQSGAMETIELGRLRSFCIQPMAGCGERTQALSAA